MSTSAESQSPQTTRPRRVPPLAFKPDAEEAARRWEAYYAGDLIDRPVVSVSAPRAGVPRPARPRCHYHEKVHAPLEEIIDRELAAAEATFWGGEAFPSFFPSFGPDEVAVFCGAELAWSPDSPDTNWSKPFVEDWDEASPLRLREDHPLWRRMIELNRRAAERMAGKMLIGSIDLHTNMDILAPIRGPQRLCIDLLTQPETIDRVMADARAVFVPLWRALAEAARMDERGYVHNFFSMDGAAWLQCDFSCMINSEMFRRWVLPALEEEASIVRHAAYHWDGPNALIHADDLIASRGLHTLSFVPGAGHGSHLDYLDLFKRIQAGGKAVHFVGSLEQVKQAHRELRPNKTFYQTWAPTQAQAEELLDWFVKNT